MAKKYKVGLLIFVVAIFLLVAGVYLAHTNIPVLEPAGSIGFKERNLIFIGLLLSVIVVIPTFALAIFIIWKYRETNKRAKKYSPDWDHSRAIESVWWGVPTIIITILSVITWQSSHALDPFKALAASDKTLTVEVVAMDWKWLFIYPNQNIASINLVDMPVNVPVDFEITSDTVMNSFWIPQLGGQIYAMPGMNTQLNELAYKVGNYLGSPANIAGDGYARMDFTAKVDNLNDFNEWIQNAQRSPQKLNDASYAKLAKPSESVPVSYYSSATPDLYQNLILKYMEPDMTAGGMGAKKTSNMDMAMPGTYMP